MLDFNPLFEFSRTHCIAICAFLVPTNLLLTLQTLILTGLRRPPVQVRQAAILACLPALIMMAHVWTWLIIGVIMAPTYILLALGSVCIGLNVWAMTHSSSMARLLQSLYRFGLKCWQQLATPERKINQG